MKDNKKGVLTNDHQNTQVSSPRNGYSITDMLPKKQVKYKSSQNSSITTSKEKKICQLKKIITERIMCRIVKKD